MSNFEFLSTVNEGGDSLSKSPTPDMLTDLETKLKTMINSKLESLENSLKSSIMSVTGSVLLGTMTILEKIPLITEEVLANKMELVQKNLQELEQKLDKALMSVETTSVLITSAEENPEIDDLDGANRNSSLDLKENPNYKLNEENMKLEILQKKVEELEEKLNKALVSVEKKAVLASTETDIASDLVESNKNRSSDSSESVIVGASEQPMCNKEEVNKLFELLQKNIQEVEEKLSNNLNHANNRIEEENNKLASLQKKVEEIEKKTKSSYDVTNSTLQQFFRDTHEDIPLCPIDHESLRCFMKSLGDNLSFSIPIHIQPTTRTMAVILLSPVPNPGAENEVFLIRWDFAKRSCTLYLSIKKQPNSPIANSSILQRVEDFRVRTYIISVHEGTLRISSQEFGSTILSHQNRHLNNIKYMGFKLYTQREEMYCLTSNDI